MGTEAKAPVRVAITAQSLLFSLLRLRKCSVASSAVNLITACVMVAVLMYSQFQPCAKTYAMETWKATAWKRKMVLKLTNIDIQPATSRCVLKKTLDRASPAPPGAAAAARRNARVCA